MSQIFILGEPSVVSYALLHGTGLFVDFREASEASIQRGLFVALRRGSLRGGYCVITRTKKRVKNI